MSRCCVIVAMAAAAAMPVSAADRSSRPDEVVAALSAPLTVRVADRAAPPYADHATLTLDAGPSRLDAGDRTIIVPTAWQSLVDGLPFTIGPVVQIRAAMERPSQGCEPSRVCGRVPHASNLIGKRDEVFGPIEQTGWTPFAHVGNERVYAYPETVRSKQKSAGASAAWGFGAQIDALRLAGLGASSHDVFAVGEVRAVYTDLPTPSADRLRAQITVGIGF